MSDDFTEDEAVLNGDKIDPSRPNPRATDTFIVVANSLGRDALVEVFEDGGRLCINVDYASPVQYGWPMMPKGKTRVVGLERQVLSSLFPQGGNCRTYGPAKFGHQLPESQSRHVPQHCFTVKPDLLRAVTEVSGKGVSARFHSDPQAGITRIDLYLPEATN